MVPIDVWFRNHNKNIFVYAAAAYLVVACWLWGGTHNLGIYLYMI